MPSINREELLNSVKRVVVKIGTNSISTTHGLDLKLMESIVNQVQQLHKQKIEVLLVSSGAIGSGAQALKLKQPVRRLDLQQASAAVGQPLLMEAYGTLFAKHKLQVAQILLTSDIFGNRQKYLNLRTSFERLLKLGVVPIFNENDVVSVDEIGTNFFDNDRLSALIASKLNADLLINLTIEDGLFTANPNHNKNAELISVVDQITPKLERMAGKPSMGGRGGMYSKIQAAKLCQKAGIFMLIANCKAKDVLARALTGENIGTLIIPKQLLSNRERWIAFAQPKGILIVDAGAGLAIQKSKSLLAVGVRKIIGRFEKNAVVSVVCKGSECAKGLTAYSSKELQKISGLNSKEVTLTLGKKSKPVILSENLIKTN